MTGNPNTLERLDELLAFIDRFPPTAEDGLLQEHVQEARTYWLGAMPAEFRFNLNLARESLERMPNTELRRTGREILEEIVRCNAEDSNSHTPAI